MKRILTTLLILAGITISSTLAYSTVTYILNKTVEQSVTVGNTVQYTEGLIIELESFEPYTLTFFDIEETDTQKHYITYVYSYTVMVSGTDIEVSNLTNDIIVTNLTYTDTTISITFSLNQELEFTAGDILNISFYFEAVEQTAVNMNDTTIDKLVSIGFTLTEATDIIAYEGIFSNLADVYINVDIADAITRFEPLVNDGTIVFE